MYFAVCLFLVFVFCSCININGCTKTVAWGRVHAQRYPSIPAPPLRFQNDRMRVAKMSFRNKRKRSSRIDFTHRTFAEKGGGMLKKARIQKKKVEPY